jgi:hypothetical protein
VSRATQTCSTCRRPARAPFRQCWACHLDAEREVAFALGFERGHESGRLLGRAEAERDVQARFEAQRRAEPPRPVQGIAVDQYMWRRVAALIHPDKHAGSRLSNELMAWWNAQRARVLP